MTLLRRRSSLFVLAAVCGTTLLGAGCGTESSTVTTSTVTVTSGQPAPPSATPTIAETTRDFAVGDFTRVHLDAHYNVIVNVGSPKSVRAQGDSAALDLLDIRAEGGTLIAGVKPDAQWPANSRVTVTVTTPAVTGAEVSGSGEMRVGAVTADAFTIDVSGSGEIEVPQLAVQRLEISSSGSGDIDAGGTADEAVIRLDGSGEADLEQLVVKRADIDIGGSGDLDIQATESVTGTKSGSGEVEVTGGAACSVSSSGSGEVACR